MPSREEPTRCLLLLDTEVDERRLISAIAARAGWSVVGAQDQEELVESLVAHAKRVIGAEWAAVVSMDEGTVIAAEGPIPSAPWLLAFVAGSQESARVTAGEAGAEDLVWTPLPAARLALVLGRDGTAYRARERRQVAALGRIVDTRFRELARARARMNHPSCAPR